MVGLTRTEGKETFPALHSSTLTGSSPSGPT